HNGSSSRFGSLITTAVAALFLFLIATCTGQENKSPAENKLTASESASGSNAESQDGMPKQAPDFTLKDSHGQVVRLSDFRGKVVLLDFWATWCGPCRMTIPELNALAKKYQDQGVVVLGVSLDEKGWPAIKNFTKRQAIDYTVVLSTPEVQKAYDNLL